MHNLSSLYKKKLKIRKRLRKQNIFRLTVYKSNKHIYAQVYTSNANVVLVSASSIDKEFKDKLRSLNLDGKMVNKMEIAKLVGNLLADRIKNNNIKQVVFDRSGFKFHGRIKAIADAIRCVGIKC